MMNECRLDPVDQQNKWFHMGTKEKISGKEGSWMMDSKGIDYRQPCQLGEVYAYIDDNGMVPRPRSFLAILLRLALVSHLLADITVFMIGLFTLLKYRESPLGKQRIKFSIVSVILLIAFVVLIVFIEQRSYQKIENRSIFQSPGGVCFGISCPVDELVF